ncbi:MAG TPA: hypothetical protein VGG14_19890 [Candidatus Sulfotelmatobacter sp.]
MGKRINAIVQIRSGLGEPVGMGFGRDPLPWLTAASGWVDRSKHQLVTGSVTDKKRFAAVGQAYRQFGIGRAFIATGWPPFAGYREIPPCAWSIATTLPSGEITGNGSRPCGAMWTSEPAICCVKVSLPVALLGRSLVNDALASIPTN